MKENRLAFKRPWVALLVALLSFLASGACSGRAESVRATDPGVLDLRLRSIEEPGPVIIEGPWAFYWRDLHPDAASRPTAFGPISHSWIAAFSETVPGLGADGYATYRIKILLPENYAEQNWAVQSGGQLGSLLVRANGAVVLESGVPGENAQETIDGAARGKARFRVPYDADGVVTLDVVIANFGHPRGGAGGDVLFGTAQQIETASRSLAARDWFVTTGLFLFGLYHLGMFLIRRRERVLLYFGLFVLLGSLRMLATGEALILELVPSLPWEVYYRIGYFTYDLMTVTALLYVNALFPRPRFRRAMQASIGIGLCFVLIVFLPTGRPFLSELNRYFNLNGAFVIVFWTGTAISALRRRELGAPSFFLGTLVLLTGAVHDILENLSILQTDQIFPFALMVFVVSQSLIIYRRFAGAFTAVELLSNRVQEANEELSRLSSVKDEFMANLSHELRTPLTVIRGAAEMLELEGLSEDSMLRSARRIKDGSEQLAGYVDDLMLVTDIESSPALALASIPTQSLLTSVVDGCQELAREHEVSLQMAAIPDSRILADERLLRRALQNVIKNAIIYNKPGGHVKIDVLPGETGFAILRVTDDGMGIPADELQAVFEKFHRVDRYSNGGVGIGLFLARRIVELHGGRIVLESEPGNGTRVLLSLQTATAQKERQQAEDGKAPHLAGT